MSDERTPTWKVVAVVVFYMAVALVMVMTCVSTVSRQIVQASSFGQRRNKWVLNSSSLPLTFLFLQLAISVVLLHLLSFVPAKHQTLHYDPPRWTKKTIWGMVPVSTVNIVGLAANILCLSYVDVTYFQVARGLTLPMTVLLSSITTRTSPAIPTILSCGLVTWGFTYSFFPSPFSSASVTEGEVGTPSVLAAFLSSEAPMLGMLLGVFSAAMVAVHAVLIKSALKNVEGRTMDLAYWQNALCAIAVLPGIALTGELGGMWRLVMGLEGSPSAFLIGSAVTGVVGFLICLAGLLSIKVTSPVTHMFSSAVRSVLQTMLGVWLFKDIINASRIVSIFLILAGSCLYTYFRSRTFNAPPPPTKEDAERAGTEPLMSERDVEKQQEAK